MKKTLVLLFSVSMFMGLSFSSLLAQQASSTTSPAEEATPTVQDQVPAVQPQVQAPQKNFTLKVGIALSKAKETVEVDASNFAEGLSVKAEATTDFQLKTFYFGASYLLQSVPVEIGANLRFSSYKDPEITMSGLNLFGDDEEEYEENELYETETANIAELKNNSSLNEVVKDGKVEALQFAISATYNFETASQLVPYVGLELFPFIKLGSLDSEFSPFAAAILGGAKYRINESFVVFGEASYEHMFDKKTSKEGLNITVGGNFIQFLLGLGVCL